MKPFEGVKIVDLSTVIAAASASRIFADQGADVIKVEPLSGELHRLQGMAFGVGNDKDENPVFDVENANKSFISLDLKSAAGKEIVFKLLKDADVLITNYREDALARLGLRFDDIQKQFPGLVYGHINGYGQKGNEAQKAGYDGNAYFGRTGLCLDTGTSESYPLVNLAGMGDHPTGVALAQGVSAALYKKLKTGQGDKVSVSLYHTGIWTSAALQPVVQVGQTYPKPYSEPALLSVMGHPYKTADGEWVVFMLFDFDKYWSPLCESLGRDDLIDDARFNTRMANRENHREFVEILSSLVATKSLSEWSLQWNALDIPFDRLGHMADVADDEQALVNDFLRPLTYPSGKTFYMPTPPIQFRKGGQSEYRPAGDVGANTQDVLMRHGYSEEQIKELLKEKVIRVPLES